MSAGAVAQAPAPPTAKAGAVRKAGKAKKPSAAQPQAPVQPAVQTPPPQPVVPLRPEQMPPTAPQVMYQDGQLSIVAQNSTLSSILSAVRAQTGAQVEMPPETAYDRVAVQLGPGNPRAVLSSLLEGSRFDYIVLGSAEDPNTLSQVILTPHRGGASTAIAGGGQPQPGMAPGMARPGGAPFVGGVTRPEMNADEEEPVEVTSPPEPNPVVPQAQMQVQPQTYQPGQQAPGMQGGQAPVQSITPGQQGSQVKTPQQLLEELQKMQQQLQQENPRQQRRAPPE
jgi:hypothetical protein